MILGTVALVLSYTHGKHTFNGSDIDVIGFCGIVEIMGELIVLAFKFI